MSIRLFILFFLSAFLIEGSFAVEPSVFVSNMPYEIYTKNVIDCDSPSKSWNSTSEKLVGKLDYPELDTKKINETIKKWSNESKTFSETEQNRLRIDLDPVRIGNFSGFKALEVARIGYRTRMNQLFACAIIGSRISSIDGLQAIVNKKIQVKKDEITEKLKKETNKYKELQKNMNCITGSETQKFSITSVTDTAGYQYCRYRHYLEYLDSNTIDLIRLQGIEQGIGSGSGTKLIKTTEGYVNKSNIYTTSISSEISRADTTIQKAIRTFLEMDQTYQIHILLSDFIYADYVNLRKALSYYMNLSSQLYQKANNAQSSNK